MIRALDVSLTRVIRVIATPLSYPSIFCFRSTSQVYLPLVSQTSHPLLNALRQLHFPFHLIHRSPLLPLYPSILIPSLIPTPKPHLHFATSTDDNVQIRDILSPISRLGILHFLHYIHAREDLAEDDMLPVQERSWDGGYEELRTVAIRACVGHRQKTRLSVFPLKVLVRKGLRAVDTRRARAVAVDEVATLAHEIFDNPMEFTPLVPLRPAQMILRLPRAKLPEILRRLGHDVGEELELDAPQWLSSNSDVEEYQRIPGGREDSGRHFWPFFLWVRLCLLEGAK